MDKNFFIAILLMTLLILIYFSPQYQKRFGREIPRKTAVEQTRADSLRKSEAARPQIAEPPEKRKTAPEKTITAPFESEKKEITQINAPAAEETFILENEDVKLSFSTRGGVITNAVLKRFNGKSEDEPVQLISEGESWYGGFIEEDDAIIDLSDILFSPKTITDTHAVLEAELIGDYIITKEFILESEGYILKAQTHLSGNWGNSLIHFTWHGPINDTEIPFKQLKIWPFSMFIRDELNAYKKIVYLGNGSRTTIIDGKEKTRRIYPKEDHSQKLESRKTGKGEDFFVGELNWYAVRNKYFISAAMPHDTKRWSASSQYRYADDEKWFDFTLTKNISDGNTDVDIYLGPLSYDILKGYGRNLTDSMEFSFWKLRSLIRPLSVSFLWTIKKLHTVIPNWGLVIIIFSILIKIILFPLSKKSFTSMRKMSSLQPQINELRAQYKNNPQMLHKKTMELYKKEGINPLSGCLPMLLQMPVFFALYPVVGRAIELRQAMFIPHWIEDLSRPDPFYILPIAMGISMFFQQRPTIKDPNQKPMLYIMPVMMVILFANFSSGLTLYWFMFNIISYLQQKIHRS